MQAPRAVQFAPPRTAGGTPGGAPGGAPGGTAGGATAPASSPVEQLVSMRRDQAAHYMALKRSLAATCPQTTVSALGFRPMAPQTLRFRLTAAELGDEAFVEETTTWDGGSDTPSARPGRRGADVHGLRPHGQRRRHLRRVPDGAGGRGGWGEGGGPRADRARTCRRRCSRCRHFRRRRVPLRPGRLSPGRRLGGAGAGGRAAREQAGLATRGTRRGWPGRRWLVHAALTPCAGRHHHVRGIPDRVCRENLLSAHDRAGISA